MQSLRNAIGSFVLFVAGRISTRKERPLAVACRNDFCVQSTARARVRLKADTTTDGRIRGAAGRSWRRERGCVQRSTCLPNRRLRNPAGRQSIAPALTSGDIHGAAGKGRRCGRSVGSWGRRRPSALQERRRRARRRRLRGVRIHPTPPAHAPSAFESLSRDWPDAAGEHPRRYVVVPA